MTNDTVQLAGFVPVPNALFAEIPTLSDTELRVILVIMRNTLGWREKTESGGTVFRQRCWLSHSALKESTGRSSAVVSVAIHGLVSRGLIIVENERGQPLPTADDRRRNMGRLYMRLVDKVWKTERRPDNRNSWTTTYKKGIYIQGEPARNLTLPERPGSGFTHVGTILERRE